MNGIHGQENVDNELDIEYVLDEANTNVTNQNVTEATECPRSVHTYLANTTRMVFQNEIMPEIEIRIGDVRILEIQNDLQKA